MIRHSAIYAGSVTHRRAFPVTHRLRYGVWYVLVDLDELGELDRVRGMAVDRPAIVSFRTRDHGARDGSPLRPWIERRLAEAGVDLEGGAVRILCHPRVLGYVFNPLTVWFCHGPAGDLRAVLYEVGNTFGEWHHYLVPVDAQDRGPHVFTKELFVSPFIDMDATYEFHTDVPGERLAIAVRERVAQGQVLTVALVGRRLPMTTRDLIRVLLRYPLVTLKTIGGIHWEATKLWCKGAPYRRRGAPPAHDLTVVTAPRIVPPATSRLGERLDA
ncbi:MAG: DUF1365 domain-containing protein [Actinomycetota bacterium]